MKKLTLLLFVVLGGCSPKTVATLSTQPNRVLYTSNDISQVSTVDSISRIKPDGLLLGRNLKLTLRTGERKTVLKKDIWGYSDEKGHVWRRFKNAYYQVLQISDVVEYDIIELRHIGSTLVNQHVRKYSKTMDSKIVGSRNRALQISDELKTD